MKRNADAGFAYLIKEVETDKLLAWALVATECWSAGQPEVYLYVRNSLRRQGYGSRLIRAVHKDLGRLIVFPHDDVSEEFFSVFPDSMVDR